MISKVNKKQILHKIALHEDFLIFMVLLTVKHV